MWRHKGCVSQLLSASPSEKSLAVLTLGKYPHLQQVSCGRKKKQRPWQQFPQLEMIIGHVCIHSEHSNPFPKVKWVACHSGKVVVSSSWFPHKYAMKKCISLSYLSLQKTLVMEVKDYFTLQLPQTPPLQLHIMGENGLISWGNRNFESHCKQSQPDSAPGSREHGLCLQHGWVTASLEGLGWGMWGRELASVLAGQAVLSGADIRPRVFK